MPTDVLKRSRGRPKGAGVVADVQFVREISEQALVSYYNDHQEELKAGMKRDPTFVNKMGVKAVKNEPLVRTVLRAMAQVGAEVTREQYVAEVCYLVYLDQLEESPTMLQRALDAGRGPIFRERSAFYIKPVTRILNAIERVQSGTKVVLKRPPLVNLDDDDEF